MNAMSAESDATGMLTRRARQVEAALSAALDSCGEAPPALVEAMRYSLLGGGKRLRPALVLECCAVCGGRDDDAMPAAVAVECVHAFSLIHDDLPCMDDDDLRRGRPTSHKVFGEAMAVLAGDALLSLAFEWIAHHVADPAMACEMIRTLGGGAGWTGMIGGQVLDLAGQRQAISAKQVARIHEMKTSRLIAAACRLGGVAAGAGRAECDALWRYGERLGLAFQAVDDLLDATSTTAALGKKAGKDAEAGKQTLPRAVGVEEGWRQARRLAADAVTSLAPFGGRAAPLAAWAKFAVERSA